MPPEKLRKNPANPADLDDALVNPRTSDADCGDRMGMDTEVPQDAKALTLLGLLGQAPHDRDNGDEMITGPEAALSQLKVTWDYEHTQKATVRELYPGDILPGTHSTIGRIGASRAFTIEWSFKVGEDVIPKHRVVVVKTIEGRDYWYSFTATTVSPNDTRLDPSSFDRGFLGSGSTIADVMERMIERTKFRDHRTPNSL